MRMLGAMLMAVRMAIGETVLEGCFGWDMGAGVLGMVWVYIWSFA